MAATSAGAARDVRTGPAVDDDEELSVWERSLRPAKEVAVEEPEVPETPTVEETPAEESPEDAPDEVLDAPPVVASLPGLEEEASSAGEAMRSIEPTGSTDTDTEVDAPTPKRRLGLRRARRATATDDADVAPGYTWRHYRLAGVVGVVVLALLAGVVVFGVQWLGQRSTDADRQAAASAARQTASSLTTLSFNTVDADVRRVMDSTTGDFRNQFTQSADSFTNVVRQARVETTSEVVASGVQSYGDGKARVLVAVRSQVRNSQSPDPQVRNYRMAMDLQREGDRWLTNNVEFVP